MGCLQVADVAMTILNEMRFIFCMVNWRAVMHEDSTYRSLHSRGVNREISSCCTVAKNHTVFDGGEKSFGEPFVAYSTLLRGAYAFLCPKVCNISFRSRSRCIF